MRSKVDMVAQGKVSLEQARARLGIVIVFFLVVYGVVLVRSADLAIAGMSENDSFFQLPVMASELNKNMPDKMRGDITDRNGVLLARSIRSTSLYADPMLIQEPDKTAKQLAAIFPDLVYGDLLKKLQSRKRFAWIERNITPVQQEHILAIGDLGLQFKDDIVRVYPQGDLVSHFIGVSGVDQAGLSGIEKEFDKLLLDKKSPIALSLDVRLQHIVKREVEDAMASYDAQAGAAMIMDIKTGEVLAAVSLPDFDPNDFLLAKGNEKFNRLTLGVYELGSSFKIFSVAAYLEFVQKAVSKTFDATYPLEVGRFKIRDFHPEKRVLTLPEVFVHSSNIGTALMAQEVGSERFQSFLSDLGLFSKAEIEIPERGAPIVPSPWRDVNTLTASYGHGIAVSPLQLTQAVATILNDGLLVQPTLIYTDRSKEKNDIRVVSEKTSSVMRQLMRLVVTDGTGKRAGVNGFLVGGKTGTAEKPHKGQYSKEKLISSFVGAFPMNDPHYVVFVMLDEPKGIKETYGYATGGWVAAPAVSKIIASMVNVLGLKPKVKPESNGLKKYIQTDQEV